MRNQKVMFLFMYTFLAMGMMLNGIVLADENGSNSGSSEGSNDVSTASVDEDDDETEDEVEVEVEDEDEDREERIREKREFKSEFTDENGNKVKIERKVEIDGNKVKIKIIKIVTDEFGNEERTVIEIEREDGKRKVKIEGESEIETELEIEQDENESDLQAVLSNGEKTRLRVLPDEARQIIMERLKALNITNMTLEEINDRNIPRVVYQIEANKHGRFLGVFKLALKVDSQVDPETGEVLDVNKPWWAILVAEQDEEVPAVTDESSTTDTFLENTTSNESDIAA